MFCTEVCLFPSLQRSAFGSPFGLVGLCKHKVLCQWGATFSGGHEDHTDSIYWWPFSYQGTSCGLPWGCSHHWYVASRALPAVSECLGSLVGSPHFMLLKAAASLGKMVRQFLARPATL